MTEANDPWTCACGRTWGGERAKCAACGEARGAAARTSVARPEPAAPARRAGFQAGAPVAPAPRGAPPVRLPTRTLLLEVPRVCCCCLGAPQGAPHQIVVGERGGFGLDVTDTLIGMGMLAATGFGWFTIRHERGMETCLRAPVCARCRAHVTGFERAWLVAGGLAFAALLVALFVSRPTTGEGFLTPLGIALGVLVGGGLALSLVLGRPGPDCAGSRPVAVAQRGDAFLVTFGNHAYGRRVADMNPLSG